MAQESSLNETNSNLAEIVIPDQKNEIYVDNFFEVPIYLNTKGQSLNLLDLRVKYDPSKIEVASLTTGDKDPIFGFWVEFPKYDNIKGEISLIGVILNGINTESGYISSVNFKAINPGQNIFSLSDLSSVYLNDGKGTKTELVINSKPYEILAKKIEDFEISLNPEFNPDSWLPYNSIKLEWPIIPSALGYNVLLNQDPNILPKIEINQTENYVAYDNLDDGEWYFSLRINKDGVWSEPYSLGVKVDTTKPDDLVLNIEEKKKTFGPSDYLISFFTNDLPSGIDHYEIAFSELINGISSPTNFISTTSPYLLKSNSLGHKNPTRVIVRAYDRAGNFNEAYKDIDSTKKINFNFDKYLYCRYRFYWCWPFWIIILILLFIIYRLYKYFKKRKINQGKKEIVSKIPDLLIQNNNNNDSSNNNKGILLASGQDEGNSDLPLPPYLENEIT